MKPTRATILIQALQATPCATTTQLHTHINLTYPTSRTDLRSTLKRLRESKLITYCREHTGNNHPTCWQLTPPPPSILAKSEPLREAGTDTISLTLNITRQQALGLHLYWKAQP